MCYRRPQRPDSYVAQNASLQESKTSAKRRKDARTGNLTAEACVIPERPRLGQEAPRLAIQPILSDIKVAPPNTHTYAIRSVKVDAQKVPFLMIENPRRQGVDKVYTGCRQGVNKVQSVCRWRTAIVIIPQMSRWPAHAQNRISRK